jgi:NADH:ubiquinone oxidoreductase subunit E
MEYKYLTPDLLEKVNKYLEKFPYREQAIIPTLHEILEKYRDIPDDALPEVADYLKVKLARVEEIVSFYDMFRFKKNAKNHIRICRNLPCHLANYQNLLEMIKELTNADVGKNSPDGKWYIELVECIGSCAIAPAFLINNDLYDGSKIKTKEDLKKILDRYE